MRENVMLIEKLKVFIKNYIFVIFEYIEFIVYCIF